MTVESSISLTNHQDRLAHSLVEARKDASLSSILQHGLDLLQQEIEAEDLEAVLLRRHAITQCEILSSPQKRNVTSN